MKKLTAIAASTTLVLALSGCASIVHGTNQKETFVSMPTAANIELDGVNYGKTPQTIKLTRHDAHVVTISLPGYQTTSFKLTREVSGWYFANIPLGLIGLVVDGLDGAIYNLKPQSGVNNAVVQGKKNTLTIILEKNGRNAAIRGQKIGQLKKANQ